VSKKWDNVKNGTTSVEHNVCYSCGHVNEYIDEAYEDHLSALEDEFLGHDESGPMHP
jgi:hypothetical protein